MSDQQPASRQDLAELESRILAAIRETLDGRLDAVEQRLKSDTRQVAHDVETRILSAIHDYAERGELRLHRLETAEASTAERVARLEAGGLWADLQRRLLELERRVYGKP